MAPPIDTSHPHSARVWNYWLGGKDDHPADQALGDLILRDFPEMVDVARAQRTFLLFDDTASRAGRSRSR